MRASNNLPAALQGLLQAHRYGAAIQTVDVVETHISWVLLAGDHAYKIKKPLKLPFLDFSTLAMRKQYCEDELRLNQRFAPDLYLAVLPIRLSPQHGLQLGGLEGTVVEYAVQMRRFDEAGRLDRVCARGELTAAHMSDLADTVAAFHQHAAVATASASATATGAGAGTGTGTRARFGSPEQVLAPALDNFHDLAQLMPDPAVQDQLAALRAWTVAQHQTLADLMHARLQAGRVRECHGDLHLANMVLINGRVRLFDCLEFNEDLRWIDVANEIAFTYVDLLDHGQPGLANWFVDEMLSRTGDYEAAQLLCFYAVYRAMVRAKVAAIRAGQSHGGFDDALVCIAQAQQLIAPHKPRLIITHGLAGCGKTFASNTILQNDAQARTLRLRSDVERRRLFGLQRNQHSGAAISAGIYNADAHDQTYTHLQQTAQSLLLSGWSVIVDAAFLRRADRDTFHALADANGAGFAILAPQADITELRRRILARRATGVDASEATVDVLEKQLQWIEALGDDERAQTLG